MSDPLDFSGKSFSSTAVPAGIGAEQLKLLENAREMRGHSSPIRRERQSRCQKRRTNPGRSVVIECDVTNPAQVESMMIGDMRQTRRYGRSRQ